MINREKSKNMKFNIQPVSIHLRDSLNERIQEKFNKIENRYPFVTSSTIYLKVDNSNSHENKLIEAELHLKPNHEIFAQAESDSFETALDDLLPKLKKQLDRHKEKLNSYH